MDPMDVRQDKLKQVAQLYEGKVQTPVLMSQPCPAPS